MEQNEKNPTISPENPLLTVAAIGRMFSVRGYTVREWLREGKLKNATKVNGRWRVPLSEVQKYANELYGDKNA